MSSFIRFSVFLTLASLMAAVAIFLGSRAHASGLEPDSLEALQVAVVGEPSFALRGPVMPALVPACRESSECRALRCHAGFVPVCGSERACECSRPPL